MCRVVVLMISAVTLAVATTAFAASGISPKFDGHYRGTITPAAISTQLCPKAEVDDLQVRNGHIRPDPKIAAQFGGSWQFDGFVTEEGFVSGHAITPAGTRVPFEGRVAQEGAVATLTGGIMDEPGGCAWLVRLDLD